MSKTRRAIEIVTPVLVALLFVWVVVTTLNRADERAQESRAAQVQACAAVKGSNDATLAFITGRIRANPANDTAEAESFITDLGTTYKTQETKCLVKP